VTGIGHVCDECEIVFDLCYKCYELRKVLHDPSHHFTDHGPEFIEDPLAEEPSSPLPESPAEETDSDSDSESAFSSSSSASPEAASGRPDGKG